MAADGPAAERGVRRLIRPRDESGESAGLRQAQSSRLVLQLADAHEVFDAVAERLDVAEHHRGRRRHADPVCRAHHVEPLGRRALVWADRLAHGLDEYLGAAARQRVEARVAQPPEHRLDAQVVEAREVDDLRRRERVDVDGEGVRDVPEHLLEKLEPQIGVQAALHEELRAAEGDHLVELRVELVAR